MFKKRVVRCLSAATSRITGTPTAQASRTLMGTPEPQRMGASESVAWEMIERMSRGASISVTPADLCEECLAASRGRELMEGEEGIDGRLNRRR